VLLRTTDTAVVNDENRASDNNFSVTCHNVTVNVSAVVSRFAALGNRKLPF